MDAIFRQVLNLPLPPDQLPEGATPVPAELPTGEAIEPTKTEPNHSQE